jgi:small subunit ribosomal protein S20
LAHSKSALKRWRQADAAGERNKSVRSEARTAVKSARVAIASGVADDAQAAVREAAGILDRAAKRRVIHKNAASRHKSRLMKHANQAAVGAATAEAPKKTRKPAAKPAAPRAKAPAKEKAPAKAPAKAAAKAAAKPRTTKAKAAANE